MEIPAQLAGYRAIEPGETIQAGDEYLSFTTNPPSWKPFQGEDIGKPFRPYMIAARREVKNG